MIGGDTMTYEEVKTAVQSIVSSPDEAATLAAPLLEAIRGDYSTMENLAGEVSQQAERIKSLQDTNMRLFLQVTGEPQQTEEPEQTPTERADAFWARFNEEV